TILKEFTWAGGLLVMRWSAWRVATWPRWVGVGRKRRAISSATSKTRKNSAGGPAYRSSFSSSGAYFVGPVGTSKRRGTFWMAFSTCSILPVSRCWVIPGSSKPEQRKYHSSPGWPRDLHSLLLLFYVTVCF